MVKFPNIGPGLGPDTRNIINAVINHLNKLGYTYDESLRMMRELLKEYDGVQEQLDNLIIESGNANAEVSQARGNHDLLYKRFEANENYAGVNNKTATQTDFVEMLQNTNSFGKGTCEVLYGSSRTVTFTMPVSKENAVTYKFQKNSVDDFIMFLDGWISKNEEINAVKEEKNYDEENGTFIKLYPPNYYTTTVGDSFSFDFSGIGFTFVHTTDDRGGVWRFDVDNGSRVVDVSTYADPKVVIKDSLVVDDLPDAYHQVTATFIGDDPNNPPSDGTSRGWTSYDDGSSAGRKAIQVMEKGTGSVKRFDALYSFSNKEFALDLRRVGDTDFNFIPAHNGVGTAFKLMDQQLYLDGNLTPWDGGSLYASIDKFQIVQRLQGKLPENPSVPLMDIFVTHTITTSGLVEVKTKVKMLERCEIRKGYGIMAPVWNSFAEKVASGFNIKRTVGYGDNSNEYFVEDDDCFSYIFYNDMDANKKNIGLAYRLNDAQNTLRIGEPDRFSGEYLTWLEHRTTDMSKLYHGILENHIAEVGEEFSFSASFIMGEMPFLSDMI